MYFNTFSVQNYVDVSPIQKLIYLRKISPILIWPTGPLASAGTAPAQASARAASSPVSCQRSTASRGSWRPHGLASPPSHPQHPQAHLTRSPRPVWLVGVALLPTLPSVAQSGLTHHQVRHLCPPRHQMQPLAAECPRGHRWMAPRAGASGPGRGGVRVEPAPSRTAVTTARKHREGHSGSALEASDRTAPSHGALPRPQ